MMRLVGILKRYHYHERLPKFAAVIGSGSAIACLVARDDDTHVISRAVDSDDTFLLQYTRWIGSYAMLLPTADCQEPTIAAATTFEPAKKASSVTASKYPSWVHRTLAYLHLKSLPLPRILLQRGDPAFRMNSKHVQQRQKDEQQMQELVRGALQERDPERLKALNQACLELAYGKGVTLKSRQDFVHRHGCTAWTDEVLDTLVTMGKDRGIVEIGAGNGQWARALTERYEKFMGYDKSNDTAKRKRKKKTFDFVLAFDDQSELPLDQSTFNKQTQIHHDFFFDNVQRCDSRNFSNTLRQWQCRGRILLLVYPPPGNMALDAVKQYASAAEMNDTVVYVGEGRGGANANDDFFAHLEHNGWSLMKIMKVKPLGSKGYEQLYILQKSNC